LVLDAQVQSAARIEYTTLEDSVAFRKLATAIQAGHYKGVFVRDESDGAEERAANLAESVSRHGVAMCYICSHPMEDKWAEKYGVTMRFYQDGGAPEYPLAVHTCGASLERLADRAQQEQDEITWPLEVEFLRGMGKVRTDGRGDSVQQAPSTARKCRTDGRSWCQPHRRDTRVLISNWKPAFEMLQRCEAQQKHARGEKTLKEMLLEKLLKKETGPVIYREVVIGVGTQPSAEQSAGKAANFLLEMRAEAPLSQKVVAQFGTRFTQQGRMQIAHLKGVKSQLVDSLVKALPGVLWIELRSTTPETRMQLENVPPDWQEDLLEPHGAEEIQGTRNLVDLCELVINSAGVVFVTVPSGVNALQVSPFATWIIDPRIQVKRYDECMLAGPGKGSNPPDPSAPEKKVTFAEDSIGNGEEVVQSVQEAVHVQLSEWKDVPHADGIAIDLMVKLELEQGRRNVFTELLDLVAKHLPGKLSMMAGQMRKWPKRLARVDITTFPSFGDHDILYRTRRVTLVGIEGAATVKVSPMEHLMRLSPETIVAKLPREPKILWSITLFCLPMKGTRLRFPQELDALEQASEEIDDVEEDEDLTRVLPVTTSEPGASTLPVRKALAVAQRAYPETAAIIKALEGKKVKEVATDLSGYRKAKGLAREHALASDGVLLKTGLPGTVGGTPVIPALAVGEALKDLCTRPEWTWRQFYTNMAHQNMPGGHQSAVRMEWDLVGVAFWTTLKQDMKAWCLQCRVCASRNTHPSIVATLRSVSSLRPCSTIVYDLVFVSPPGRRGQVGALTAICGYTRYLWVREIWAKTPLECAWALHAVTLLAGVVPRRLLSDRESSFKDKVLLEYAGLLNARQGFSLSYAPQGHGIIERANSEVHKVIGKAVESMAELEPQDWPMTLPLVSATWNDKEVADGCTPFSLMHGFFSTSTLTSTVQAIRSIPPGLPVTTWARGICAAHKLLSRVYDEHLATKHALEALQRADKVYPHEFKPGDHVLIQRPGPLKAHVVGGRGSGPWIIDTVTRDGKAVTVNDAFTGQTMLDSLTGLPDPIATSRLMRITAADVSEPLDNKLENMKVGDVVAWSSQQSINLIRVSGISWEITVTGQILEVPVGERHGAWTRRPWRPIPGDAEKVVQWRDLLILVRLNEDETLERASLDFILNHINARQ
jgi:hypothetical protein